jgi:hypothetical protein
MIKHLKFESIYERKIYELEFDRVKRKHKKKLQKTDLITLKNKYANIINNNYISRNNIISNYI